jgi:hypothetical protein
VLSWILFPSFRKFSYQLKQIKSLLWGEAKIGKSWFKDSPSKKLLRKKGLPGEGPCVTALGHAHPVTTSESSGSERSVSGCGV